MSIWDDVSSVFSGGVGNVIGSIASAGLNYLASERASKAHEKAARIQADSIAQQTAAITEANKAEAARFDTLQQQTAPGINRLSEIVAAGERGFTPLEQQQIDEFRRQLTNQLGISGLRGSGRGVVQAFREGEAGMINQVMQNRQSRVDAAAGNLARISTDALTRSATLGANTGAATGAGLAAAGQGFANAETANAAVRGQTLGEIAALIASDSKGRRSRYQEKEGRIDESGAVGPAYRKAMLNRDYPGY